MEMNTTTKRDLLFGSVLFFSMLSAVGCAPPTLFVTTAGDGRGTVRSYDPFITCGVEGDTCEYDYPAGSNVGLTATAESGSGYVGVTGTGCADIDLFTGEVLANVAKANTTCEFVFSPVWFLHVDIDRLRGGVITGRGVDCDDDCVAEVTYPGPNERAVTITLHAEADPGYDFAGWIGDCEGTDPDVTITLEDNAECSATFEPNGDFIMEVLLAGDGDGAVEVFVDFDAQVSTLCEADCVIAAEPETLMVLEALPAVGARFVRWGGDCFGDNNPHSILIDVSKSCTAEFEIVNPVLSLRLRGGGDGSVGVDSSLESTSCDSDCNLAYPEGTAVTLTAAPDANSRFDVWEGECGSTNGSTATFSLDVNRTCTARFELLVQPDAGPPVVDAGTPVVDAGTPVADAGTPIVDAGTPIVDAGTPVVDAGAPVVDAGAPIVDAGTPIVDAGTPVVDAGTPVADAGSTPTDGG